MSTDRSPAAARSAENGPAQPPRWSARRLWGMVALVLAVQVGLIFWLNDPRPHQPRPAGPSPSILLVQASSEFLELTDPTLFALPQEHGFSGRAWSLWEPPDLRPARTVQQPLWLDLPADQLGADFRTFARTNPAGDLPVLTQPSPEMTVPPRPALNWISQQSRIRLSGELAAQRLPDSLEAPSWPHPDLLQDTVMQVMVNPEGRVVSATRLASSGHSPADQYAADTVKHLRFSTVPPPAGPPHTGLRWGQVVFEWHTVPPTNAPAH